MAAQPKLTFLQNIYYKIVKHIPIKYAGHFAAAIIIPLFTNLLTGEPLPNQIVILASAIIASLCAWHISNINSDINQNIVKIKDKVPDPDQRLLASISYSKPGRARNFLLCFLLFISSIFVFIYSFAKDQYKLHYVHIQKAGTIPDCKADSLLNENNGFKSKIQTLQRDSAFSHRKIDSVTELQQQREKETKLRESLGKKKPSVK